MPFHIATSKNFSKGLFLADSPPNPRRGLESTAILATAKADFVDQADIDAYAIARGGNSGDWVLVDLYSLGVR